MDKIKVKNKKLKTEIKDELSDEYKKIIKNLEKSHFHFFEKPNKEIEKNNFINEYFLNQFLNPQITFLTNIENKIIISYNKEKHIFPVHYLFESIPFPRIEINRFLTIQEKKIVISDLNNNINDSNFKFAVSGFSISKILNPSNSVFNFLSILKSNKIFLLSNKLKNNEELICICSRLINNILKSEFVICRLNLYRKLEKNIIKQINDKKIFEIDNKKQNLKLLRKKIKIQTVQINKEKSISKIEERKIKRILENGKEKIILKKDEVKKEISNLWENNEKNTNKENKNIISYSNSSISTSWY